MDTSTRTRSLAGALLLAAATVAVWWAWLGWDTGHPADPRTGSAAGTYAGWQVVGVVLSLVAVAAVAGWLLNPWLVVPVMTAAFTVAWSQQASAGAESGLWAISAILVLVGMAAGATLVSGGSHLLRGYQHRPGVPAGT
ncbi:hypothetical protein [Micromonospora rosaria]|uniref:hypothetical protein n=1 Tax=Micromonospora rosaria TaxID=47874 RepID=UPI001FDEC382|nr:hypothetical protein [Micromonospora rosaria]